MSVWTDHLAEEYGVTFETVLRTRSPRTAAQPVPVSALAGRPGGTVCRLDPPVRRDIIATMAAPADTLSRRFVAALRRRGLPAADPDQAGN